ncbi:Lrp/AsnC family transcriptional regulator [Candidatus Lokiarchaeum ossiferum]|uniref:Lrp/AsnC family transcriptional regulator n=1 Tax=Candidatus Lokiarchaeum ossiferum TaxID=2951803 RepID=UPI00352D06F0
MKKQIDDLDIEILKYLEDDARKSLKKLADELNKKTSTIYHRLQRLKSNNVILGYSIIFNPDFLNIEKIAIQKIKVKPLNISSLDDMFLKSFASFINNEFPQVLFIALSEDSKVIYLISIHTTAEDHEEFIAKLNDNPYIEDIDVEFLSQIIKGQKIFNFNEDWLKSLPKSTNKKKKKKSFDDEDDNEEERTIEIDLDEDFDELKF